MRQNPLDLLEKIVDCGVVFGSITPDLRVTVIIVLANTLITPPLAVSLFVRRQQTVESQPRALEGLLGIERVALRPF